MNRYGRALVKFLIAFGTIAVMFAVIAGVVLGCGWLLIQPFLWFGDRYPEAADSLRGYVGWGIVLVYGGVFLWCFVRPTWEGCLADVDREDAKRAERAS